MIKLNWKKGLFSSKYKLFNNDSQIGEFHSSSFNSTSFGTIKGKKLKFKNRGFFNCETEIINLNSNQLIGRIKYGSLGNKAEITINDKIYIWKYDNFLQSKWSISENKQKLINYQSSITSGSIETTFENDILLLSGFYVYNYHIILMIIIVASMSIILFAN